jgi:hypothetical protein
MQRKDNKGQAMDWVCAKCGTKELIGGEFVCGKEKIFDAICKACLIQMRPERLSEKNPKEYCGELPDYPRSLKSTQYPNG